jgi:7,8-dihydro-6-hydroxymethylpterin-pyrophosphokinase
MWSERAFVVLPLVDILDHLTDWQKTRIEEISDRFSTGQSCRATDYMLY